MTRPELVFVGQIAPDAGVSGEPVAEQARSALSRLQTVLAGRGLGLDDLLRLRLFVANLDDLPAIQRAMSAAGQRWRWPAVSVVELPASTGDQPLAAVTLDAVAAPGAHAHRRLATHSARLGPWVFVGAVPAVEPRELFDHMQELLRAQGAELRDVVKVGGWLTFAMRDYGPLGEVREALLPQTGLFPASAAVQVGRVGVGGERLAFEAIAFAAEDEAERERERAASNAPARSRLARYYADTRAGGEYVFASGEVPDGAGTAEAQAREVYERLRSHLAAHDATPAGVVHQTVFIRHTHDRDAVMQAARAFFGATIPPTTLLTVADIGFRPGCDVEIELVAATDVPTADAR